MHKDLSNPSVLVDEKYIVMYDVEESENEFVQN